MKLPVKYDDIPWPDKRKVREEYIRLQNGLCYHCKDPLEGKPPEEVVNKKIYMKLFPTGFLDNPVHLHHNHRTGLTLGAVHAYCNAVLWQYYGE